MSQAKQTSKWPFYSVLILVLMGAIWAVFEMKQPMKSYELLSTPKHVTSSQLDKIIKPYLSYSFWDVDIHQLHAEIVRLDWVATAIVQRRWPNQLRIEITEQMPVVRWGDRAFLNQKGQIFYPNDMAQQIPNYQQFVLLKAEDIQSEPLFQSFIQLQKRLDEKKWRIQKLEAFADGIWRIELLSGVVMLLPSDRWQEKLNQFFRAYPKVSKRLRKFAQIYDLRYSNGFVIQKPEPRPEPPKKPDDSGSTKPMESNDSLDKDSVKLQSAEDGKSVLNKSNNSTIQ